MESGTANGPGPRIHGYVDGELGPAPALEVERALAGDPALAAERERIETLQRLIRERLPPMAAPPGLARRIEAAIAGTTERPFFARPFPLAWAFPGAGVRAPSWRALAASVMLALIVGSSSTWLALRQGLLTPAEATADMVVASHIRALKAPQPADVASSDNHTVKPWFNGRVSEAPRVVDLGNEGFPLIGGRVDVIGRVPVPTLVYRRRQHLISLMALPSDQAPAVTSAPRSIAGYNILTWRQNGTVYWAVSDVAPPDLDAFAKAFREASG